MFSERLKSVRKQRGFTAQEMADHLLIGLRGYRHYESGAREPSFELLIRIADKLDISTDYLLGRDDFLARSAGER